MKEAARLLIYRWPGDWLAAQIIFSPMFKGNGAVVIIGAIMQKEVFKDGDCA